MSSSTIRALNIAAVLIVGLGRPALAQAPPAPAVAAERSIVILLTKERMHISTDGNLPAGASKKDLEDDGLLIHCNSCELDRHDVEKKTVTFHCRGDVIVESSLFTIRAETVSYDGTHLVAVGAANRDAELWTIKGADNKKTAFTSGSKIRFDTAKRTILVDEASSLDLGKRP